MGAFRRRCLGDEPQQDRIQAGSRGWVLVRHGGGHDVYRHAQKGVVIVPRHRELSPGVARSIAKAAGWI